MLLNPLVHSIQDKFISKRLTLSIAESCTGGYLTSQLTRISGCSAYFLGSVIAYCNDVKIKVLNVDPLILSQEGAVSESVVKQMALGVTNLTGSDYALAVSGIAGPHGGTKDKPVGTVWIGLYHHHTQQSQQWKLALTGNRSEIIHSSTYFLLKELNDILINL